MWWLKDGSSSWLSLLRRCLVVLRGPNSARNWTWASHAKLALSPLSSLLLPSSDSFSVSNSRFLFRIIWIHKLLFLTNNFSVFRNNQVVIFAHSYIAESSYLASIVFVLFFQVQDLGSREFIFFFFCDGDLLDPCWISVGSHLYSLDNPNLWLISERVNCREDQKSRKLDHDVALGWSLLILEGNFWKHEVRC